VSTNDPDALIIGAGLGGLACAARLARGGAKVLVAERHEQLGGYASAFRRGAFDFEVSLHLMDAVGPGQPQREVLERLGVAEAIELCRPAALRREIWPEHDLVIPHGIDAWLALMGQTFPAERSGSSELVDVASRAHAAFHREPAATRRATMSVLGELARRTAADVVDASIRDRRLRGMLGSFSRGWLGLPLESLSAPQFLVPWFSYQAYGGYYPRGGSAALVQALAAVIRRHGGTILPSCAARRIVVDRRRVCAVELDGGRSIATRLVVANANPITVRALLAPADFDARYLARLAKFEPSVSCIKLWLGLSRSRPVVAPADFDVSLQTSYEEVRSFDAARSGLSVVLPSSLGAEHVPAGRDVVIASMLVHPRAWRTAAATCTTLRDDATRTMLERIESSLVPELRASIEVSSVATPETFERFTNSPEGSIYGWHVRAGKSRGFRLSAATPIDGLWLCGAWTHPGAGFTSVLRSGNQLGAELLARREGARPWADALR
jgi:prolycopene isomerase